MNRRRFALPVVLAAALTPALAAAFVPLHREPDPAGAPRWSAAAHAEIGFAGLEGGVHVAVDGGFAETLALRVTGGADPADVADLEVAVLAAFAAWTNPALAFVVDFDGEAERGPAAGAEIDLFAVPGTDPVFAGNTFFGLASWQTAELGQRELANGTVLPGPALVGVDIFLNVDRIAGVAPLFTREQQLAAIQRLLMHEIGHAIGLNHPNQFPQANLDTDDDPLNAMVIDPFDPFADLIQSPNVDGDAVMSNSPASGIGALLFTALRNDDRGGRDVLYPALPGPPLECAGDCNDDGLVEIDELVLAVRVLLGEAVAEACPAFGEDGTVDAERLRLAVGRALAGCPGRAAAAAQARVALRQQAVGCGFE
jgi:hypothetical protein